jgi:thioredoxin-dependent peroxiredoxin
VLAISPQDVDSHARWAEQEGFRFALLADTDQRVIEDYGIASRLTGVVRSVFLVDTAGIVQWRYSGTVRAIFKKPKQLSRILQGMD